MKIRYTGAKYSAIVEIGEKIKKLEIEQGQPYLYLNRGINYVKNINLDQIIPMIDFNSDQLQIYPPNNGFPKLRQAINNNYFFGKSSEDNVYITNGGMSGLDLIIRTLDVQRIYTHQFYWGAYLNIMKINNMNHGIYDDFAQILDNINDFKDCAVIICDPNNPVGNKYDDERILSVMKALNDVGTVIIYDSPYRKIFTAKDDDFYVKLLNYENVMLCDSFSKNMGLSGQRIGFVHTLNEEFNKQLNINILFATNGINAFSQILIEKLLTTPEGQKAVDDFKAETKSHIKRNIDYLIDYNLLVEELYKDSVPWGIFSIIKHSYDFLLVNKIGSVPLGYFTKNQEIIDKNYSRICVSVRNENFVKFFGAI